jgi:transposase-like protein
MQKRRKFSSEQKAQIVLSVLKGESLLEVAKKHTITPSLIHKWKEHFLEKASLLFDTGKEEQESAKKIKQYEHVIAKITTQNDFLERVLAVVR